MEQEHEPAHLRAGGGGRRPSGGGRACGCRGGGFRAISSSSWQPFMLWPRSVSTAAWNQTQADEGDRHPDVSAKWATMSGVMFPTCMWYQGLGRQTG